MPQLSPADGTLLFIFTLSAFILLYINNYYLPTSIMIIKTKKNNNNSMFMN